MPKPIEEGILYISLEYNTLTHLCACGCGSKVVISISPDSWKLTYDGESISVSPSFGNWNLTCRSHYIIRKNIAYFIPEKYDAKKRLRKVYRKKD